MQYIACFEPRGRAVRHPARRLRARDAVGRGDANLRGASATSSCALIAELRDRDVDDSFLTGDFPWIARLRSTTRSSISSAIVPIPGASIRRSIHSHPAPGIDDVRITTHYYPDALKSIFSTMHEYGHGLYEHQSRASSRICRSAPLLVRDARVAEPPVGEHGRPRPAVLALHVSARAGVVPRGARRTSSSNASTRASTRRSRR